MKPTGKTTTQLLDAPHQALFVWCNTRTDYAKALAHHLGRDDLQVVSPGALSRIDFVNGRKFTGVVIDHATVLSIEQIRGLAVTKRRIAVRRQGTAA
jgi:hypothetical protein